jgi:hypothetical protein
VVRDPVPRGRARLLARRKMGRLRLRRVGDAGDIRAALSGPRRGHQGLDRVRSRAPVDARREGAVVPNR